jgi:hypothetical protein
MPPGFSAVGIPKSSSKLAASVSLAILGDAIT